MRVRACVPPSFKVNIYEKTHENPVLFYLRYPSVSDIWNIRLTWVYNALHLVYWPRDHTDWACAQADLLTGVIPISLFLLATGTVLRKAAIDRGVRLAAGRYGCRYMGGGGGGGGGGSRVERFWRGHSVSFIVHTRYRVFFSRGHVLFVCPVSFTTHLMHGEDLI